MFVGEECKPGQKTIARVLAAEPQCSDPEIDMPIEERDRRGIARDYQKLGEEERSRVYNVREEFMVQRVYSESSVDTRKLIVCGAGQLKGLKSRFLRIVKQVSKRDLTTEDWVLEV